jgi:hypothetical protein
MGARDGEETKTTGQQPDGNQGATESRGQKGIPMIIAAGVVVVLVLLAALTWHAEARTNRVASDAEEPSP